ncbi:MAG TPA: transglycosylase SLT domain-containing protein [Vicinamibacterales bacterium]|nr:transglycosylase SLT domain-containing protein [Vicinamibacterales bacterium]
MLRVRTEDGREYRFAEPFTAGRGDDCAVRITDGLVSRRHLQVECVDGVWTCSDLDSGNGVYLDGERIRSVPVGAGVTVTLGAEGPALRLEVEGRGPARRDVPPAVTRQETREDVSIAEYAERYFGGEGDDEPAGRRTVMIRRAYQQVRRRQRITYGAIVGVVAAAGLTAVGYAVYSHQQVAKLRDQAAGFFYQMKSIDLAIARLEIEIDKRGDTQAGDQLKQYLANRREAEREYDQFLSGLDLYDRPLSEQERLILRVTRLLGECEIAAPPDYINEVSSYIRKWQSSERYVKAMTTARQRGYAQRIADEFLSKNLAPQFLYLALQESSFEPFASGPRTYAGIAKGMWQFIPGTARQYGLTVGPLEAVPQPDTDDDRHHWDRATVAASRYIKDIYATDAQASALLVMASYNWGEGRVIKLIRSLDANPKDRNFWKLLERYRNSIPKQTYDYVFYIVSAAVIGENPRLFGIEIDPPLGFLETRGAAGDTP